MNSKYLKFVKNLSLASLGCVAGGVVGGELSDLVTDSEAIIAVTSTAGEYVGWFSVFWPMHAHDNPDLYREVMTNKFIWKPYLKDLTKMIFSFGVLDYLYLVGRPIAHYHFQKQGHGPAIASLLTDAICLTTYCILAIPIARGVGVIRGKG